MNILITGSRGFIAKNLIATLSQFKNYHILTIDKKSSDKDLFRKLNSADIIFHLAGVNKEINPKYLYNNNYKFTKKICSFLECNNKNVKIIYTSSIQAKLKNSYGSSKLKAEKVLLSYKRKTGSDVLIYRLPNVFGKWSKPYYNSAVATFCYQIYRKQKVIISDPNAKISLLYIDDLIFSFIDNIKSKNKNSFIKIEKTFSITLCKLVNLIKDFKKNEKNYLPNIHNSLIKNLYSTYISFFSKKDFSYKIQNFFDQRGSFSEFLKNTNFGQISYFSILPKQIRGNHYHNTKTEKFLVIAGKVRFNFINIINKKRFYISADDNINLVINTIPGWAHNIENIGNKMAKVLVWANEIFDEKKPDTIFYKV